jgi:hypothetical protein
MNAQFSIMATAKPAKPGKSYELVGGTLKSETQGAYYQAAAEMVTVGNLEEFKAAWTGLSADHCLLQGVSAHPRVWLTPPNSRPCAKDNPKGWPIQARSKEYFPRPDAGGIMVIDTDRNATLPEVLSQLHDACPALTEIGCVQATSTGAMILNEITSAVLRGHSGAHTIYLVTEASDVPRAMEVLHKRLWLAGHGWIKIAATGEMLERSAVDLAMRDSSQPLYIRAHLGEGLEQQKEFQVYTNSDCVDFLDSRTAIPDLTEQEELTFTHKIAEVKQVMLTESEEVRRQYQQERLTEMQSRGVSTGEALAMLTASMRNGDLYRSWQIVMASGERVTVKDILQRPSEFHGQYCRDPLEPDYGSSTVAIIYTDQDKPIIKTHAHGGKKYFLHEEDAPPIEPAAPAQPLELLPTHGKRHPLAQYIDYDLTPRPPSFVIPDLIDAGLVTFAGGHGVGKTSTLLPLSMVAAGLHRPGDLFAPKVWRHVIYVCEDPAQALRIIAGMVNHSDLELDEVKVKERLHLVAAKRLPPNIVAQVGEVYKAELKREVNGKETLPLVVLDTNAAVLDLEDSNSNAQISRALYELKQGFAGLPVWIVCHVSKQVKNRTDLADLSALGGVAFEADSVQNLYLIKEDKTDQRYLMLGKTRFEKRWSELEIKSHSHNVFVHDDHGDQVALTLRWNETHPTELGRGERVQQAQEDAQKKNEAELREAVLNDVRDACQAGNPLNRAGVRAKVRRRSEAVTTCIDQLIHEQWLIEVDVPPARRVNQRRNAFLVGLTTQEHDAVLRGEEVSPDKFVIPKTWGKTSNPIAPKPERDNREVVPSLR